MDYTELATEFLLKTHMLRKAKPQKKITESMQGEVFILQFIAHHEDDVLPGEISNAVNISTARIAAVLNSLENKGLITRRIDRSDRRKILVGLTQTGRDCAEKHKQAIAEDAAKMLSLLGEHDAREYVRITGRLAEIVSTCNGKE